MAKFLPSSESYLDGLLCERSVAIFFFFFFFLLLNCQKALATRKIINFAIKYKVKSIKQVVLRGIP